MLHKGTGKNLGIQIAAVVTFAVWTGVICFLGNLILKGFRLHRIGSEHEKLGLDQAEHGGHAYDFNRQYSDHNNSKKGQFKENSQSDRGLQDIP